MATRRHASSSDDDTTNLRDSTASQLKTVTKVEAAQNVLTAITLQIRARQEDLISGRKPLVLSEKVISLIEKTRRSFVRSVEQKQLLLQYQKAMQRQMQQQSGADTRGTTDTTTTGGGGRNDSSVVLLPAAVPPPPAVAVKRLVPPEVATALFDELRKVTFLVILGRIRGSSMAEQAREDDEQQKRTLLQRKRAQEHFLGMSASGGGGHHSPDHHHGSPASAASLGKVLSFQSFPNLLNLALFECHVRRIEHLSRAARFTAVGTELPPTAAMPLLGVFAALRHVECDLELGVISPVVEQLSSFCFSLRSVTITINETAGVAAAISGDRHALNAAATAVTMNRRLFADVWRPKGAQIKLLGASQKAQASAASGAMTTTTTGGGGNSSNNNNNHDDGAGGGGGGGHPGFWEALSIVKIRGDLNRRREGRSMAIMMLDDSWRSLRHVTTLMLRGLRLCSFMELVPLQGLQLLRSIDLGDNSFTTLAGASDALPKRSLRTILLDSNRISSGLHELCALGVATVDLSVNNLNQWTELAPLSSSKTLRSLDLRANALDARSTQDQNRVVNAEDIVSMILRAVGNLATMQSVNGFVVTGAVKDAADTERIRRSVEAILAQERALSQHLASKGLASKEQQDAQQQSAFYGQIADDKKNNSNSNAASLRASAATARDDLESVDGSGMHRPPTSSVGPRRGGAGKGKRVVTKGIPTRVVTLGAAAAGAASSSSSSSPKPPLAPGGAAAGKTGVSAHNNPGGVSSTGLDYLRATFGEQYIMHLPQHEYPAYLDPNDPNGAQRQMSYEQQTGEIGVAALLGSQLAATEAAVSGKGADAAATASPSSTSSSSLTLKRSPLHTPVQPVFDQFLSELRKHDWYPSSTSGATASTTGAAAAESRTKVFPLGCETMFSQVTFENACFWEVPLLPLGKQTQSQPYAVHPEGREVVLVNGQGDKNAKVNESHGRYARKVLFRIVETQVGFTRHLRLEERNLSGVPLNFFSQSTKKLSELAGAAAASSGGGSAAGNTSFSGGNNVILRERVPRLEQLAASGQGLTQDQIDAIPSFSGRYPIFSCVLPSDEHSAPVQITPKFLPVSKSIRSGGFTGAKQDDPATKSYVMLDDAQTQARIDSIASAAPGATVTSGAAEKNKKLLQQGIDMDEMAELTRQRVYGTGETVLLAGFVVPARIAAEFKRRLVHQLKTAAAKLSIQGVFREWPFIIRGEGSGEQRDASLPIEPTGKYLHDRISQCSVDMDSLARQRINNDVGSSDQELSLRLRRFVFEKYKKYSTEPIPDFDFLAYFNALSPDATMWTPQIERSLIVGVAGACMFVAENINTVDPATGLSTANSPEEHFATPRRYDLVHLRAVVCSFDLATIRFVFGGVDARRVRDLQLLSREPRLGFQLLATLARLRFLPDSPQVVAPFLELPKIVQNVMDQTAQQATAQVYFRPTNIGRFTAAPFIYAAHVFVRTTEGTDSKNPAIVNPIVYPMRCIGAIVCGWCCARLVITSKDIRLVEVREMVSVDPEQAFNRSKKVLEEPYSIDVQQPSQLLRCELSPANVFPLIFSLAFSCPSAASKEAHWTLCAPHPSTLFTIKRELKNVQRNMLITEMDLEVIDDHAGFAVPTAADRQRQSEKGTSSPDRGSGGGGGGGGASPRGAGAAAAAAASSSPPRRSGASASPPGAYSPVASSLSAARSKREGSM